MASGRAGAVALGAALTLTIIVAQGAVRRDAQVGPRDAAGLLAAVSGTPGVACDLAVRTLGNRWGASSVQPSVREPLGGTEEERSVARWAWSGRPAADDAGALLGGLASGDACVRRIAAALLTQVDDPSVRARVRERVEHAEGSERLAAITALTGERDAASQTALGALLRGDDPVFRSAAAWALGEMEATGSVPVLVDALRDADVQVRINAAWALGRIESASAIPSLVALLASDRDPKVRLAAAWALGRID
jgi:HEAT repeat protein